MMQKRLLALAFALIMVVSLAACNGNQTPPAATAAPVATTAPAVTAAAATAAPAATPEPAKELSKSGFNPLDYGYEPFANPVTIRIPVFDRARDDVPDIATNYYTKWVNENFGKNMNVTVEFIPITRTDTMGAYNLLLAGNSWPTVFMEYDWPKVTQWAADGALGSFNVDDFASTSPTWFDMAGGQKQFDMFQLNGEYIFAPALRPYWDTNYTYVTFYRKDWWRNAGLELFTTYEEYVAGMQKFMELGYTNGKPILPKQPFTENFQFYGDSEWPRNEEDWVMYSDVSVAGLPASGAYYTLKKQNLEYSLGLYSTEFELDATGGGSSAQAITDFINGEAYTYGAYLGADMPDLTAFYQNNPDAELGIIYNNAVEDPWIDAMGGHVVPQGRATNPAGMFIGFSSKATADELKAAWLYMEWLAQPDVLFYMQNGEEGKTFNYNADGAIEMIGWENQGDYWMGYGNNKDYWCIVTEVRSVGTIEETIASIAPKGLPQDFTQELIDNYYILKARADAGLSYVDPFFSVPIESVNEYSGDLRALFIEYATKLVKCDPAEFDALYEQYVAEYKAAGYQQIMDERLAAYKNGQTTLLPDIAAGRAPYTPVDTSKIVPRKYTIK